EGYEVPDSALSEIARSARGSFRDAVSTLDQLAAATSGEITVQSVLQLLGTVDEVALFRLCDLIVDRDTASALRRTSSANRPCCACATCSQSRSRTCVRAATRGSRSSSRS